MSTRNNSTITCPKCGNAQDFETWPSLNVDLDPEQKDRLLSGELMRFTCDRCGSSAEVNYPLLYHDMTRQLMVSYTAGGDTEGLSNPLFERMMQGYQLRIVPTRNQLVEKVWISSASLDDRVIELFKFTMEQQMNPEETGELLFAGIGEAGDEGEFLRFAWVTAGGSEGYNVPKASFQDFSDTITGEFGLGDPQPGEWLTIDRQYALGVFKARFSEDSDL